MKKEDKKFVPFFFTLVLVLGIFFTFDSVFSSSPGISLNKDRVVSSEVGFTSYSPRGFAGGAIVPASGEVYSDYSNYANYSDYSNPGYSNYANYSDYSNPGYSNYANYSDYSNPGYSEYSNPGYSEYSNPGYSNYANYSDYSNYANYSDSGYSNYSDYSNYVDYSDYSDSPPSAFNYSLSNSGVSSVTKTSGNAFTQNTITKTLTAGGTESVTLSLSGVPGGVSYSISNLTCSPTCASVITFTVAPTAINGTYPITVTGSPLNRQTTFNLVISGNPMTASCTASPSPALLGQTVTWTATVSGGVSPKTYSWSGTNIPTTPAPTTNPYSISYATIGQKTATVRVTDANSLQATCPTATVQINFNPLLEEF